MDVKIKPNDRLNTFQFIPYGANDDRRYPFRPGNYNNRGKNPYRPANQFVRVYQYDVEIKDDQKINHHLFRMK